MSRNRATKILKDPYDVLIRPVLTEKSHLMLAADAEGEKTDLARYTFEVHMKATKVQIRQAIEGVFGVKVASVNTVIVKPRKKTFRMATGVGGTGFTRQRKKAIIRLAKGSKTIELV